MKKISVLTPSFNTGKYIERAIVSVQNQRYKNVEHIIADGGSTDNTVEVLKKYPHLIWVSEKDKGQSDAMNKAFALSTGDIIVYLNADDYLEEGIFEKVVNEFNADASIDILVGNGTKVSPQGEPEKWYSDAEYSKCLQFYKYQFPVNPVSYYYKRKVQQRVPYNVHSHYVMDYEFILRAFQLFKTKKLEQNFGFFFTDGTNKTADISRAYQLLKKTLIIHCLKYDQLRLLPVLTYFLKRKLFGAK